MREGERRREGEIVRIKKREREKHNWTKLQE